MLDLHSAEDPSLRFFTTIHVKDQVLGNIFGGIFSDTFRQNLSPHLHCQDNLRSTSCQTWDFLLSCKRCLLTMWLEICVPNDNLVFLGIIVEVKHLANFSCPFFNAFVSKKVMTQIFFLSYPRHCDQRLIVVWVYYF